MLNKVLTTPVDELVNIVKSNKNINIRLLSTKLKIPSEIIERWLVILEEFNILKITYKGFEGYVNYIEKIDSIIEQKEKIDVENLKSSFLKKSKLKNLSGKKTQELWTEFIKTYEQDIKDLFTDKAKSKGYKLNKIENAWLLYKKDLETL